ncbi:MAG TPA: 50S ribosomal protein L35ae [Ignisphaera aggregans]|uniref:Large ribosomal subunit protein eL33 n=1 Tax=Ignisphaera aggregans TaxID=334771 RepID=A0A832YXE4_9CREN|nr:50S ribosomal protein L35ae [Ignisphaera aggregans]
MSEQQTKHIRGVIMGYRRGSNTQYNNQVLVKVFIEPKLVGTLVGAKVIASDRYGNVYRGKIIRIHSFNKSIAVVVFKPNIPGQMIGQLVTIIPRR